MTTHSGFELLGLEVLLLDRFPAVLDLEDPTRRDRFGARIRFLPFFAKGAVLAVTLLLAVHRSQPFLA
jgi:hypothetical protein